MTLSFDQLTGKLKLGFAYRAQLVNSIKELADRSYNPETKQWLVGFANDKQLREIMAMLAGNYWPNDQLYAAESAAQAYLASIPTPTPSDPSDDLPEAIKTPLIRIGDLILAAYLAGSIDQTEQVTLLSLINHLSLKDFINK